MKKEDFEQYSKNNTFIEIWLKHNTKHPYTGTISQLNETSLVLIDKIDGEITISYDDILSPIKVVKDGHFSEKKGE